MRELFAAFGSEVFRPLMTLFVPGTVAIVPWLIGLMQRNPEFYKLINENRTEASLCLVLIAASVGMLLEDFASHIEALILDREMNDETSGEHTTNWNKYLRVAYKAEPVGARYIRTMLLRMKFELNMAMSLVFVAFGVFATTLAFWTSGLIAASACGLGAIFFLEGRMSHSVLSETRKLLLGGLILLGESTEPVSDERASRQAGNQTSGAGLV
jgi:hypothetical protein